MTTLDSVTLIETRGFFSTKDQYAVPSGTVIGQSKNGTSSNDVKYPNTLLNYSSFGWPTQLNLT
jgi:hypothetical protein